MAIYERFSKRKNGPVYDVVIRQGNKKVWHRGLSKPEAERLERKLLVDKDRGLNIVESRMTLRAYVESWLRDYAGSLAETTAQTYASNLRTHVLSFPIDASGRRTLGDMPLKELKPAHIQACYGAITAHRSKKLALNVHRVLHEALAHAVRMDLISRNVCDNVVPPRAERRKALPPSLAQLDAVLAAADRTQYGPVARLAVWTGLRQGELLRLKWADVDLAGGLLYVRKAKWGSEGTVVLSQDAIDFLVAHRVSERQRLGELGPAWKDEGYVFTNALGRQMDAGGLKRAWQRIKKQVGLDVRFHDLRHAHAAMLIKAGVHPKVIQERLRHRNISTTMDIYGHLMPGLQADAAQKLNQAMRR